MEIKGIKSIKEYKYLVMFDLATYTTGVCVWDIKKNEPVTTCVLQVKDRAQLAVAELEKNLKYFFEEFLGPRIHTSEIVVSCEAMPMQAGKFTTIKTLTSLAQAHAILNLYCYKNQIDVYDYVGIAPASSRAYYKKVMNLAKDAAVGKEDLRNYLENNYTLQSKITYDESDAMFLCATLLNKKYNEDIHQLVLEQKRHRKTLKAPHAIEAVDEKIKTLEKLKI